MHVYCLMLPMCQCDLRRPSLHSLCVFNNGSSEEMIDGTIWRMTEKWHSKNKIQLVKRHNDQEVSSETRQNTMMSWLSTINAISYYPHQTASTHHLLKPSAKPRASIWETPSATPRTKGAVKHASASLWPFWAFTSRQTDAIGTGRWSHVFGWKWVANKANVVWLAESEISCQVAGCVFWKELALKHKGLFLWYASANCCLSHNSPPKAIRPWMSHLLSSG